MYRIIIPNSVKKDFKKLDKPLQRETLKLLESIAENPYQGESLTGNYTDLFKLKYFCSGVHLRIIYRIIAQEMQILVLLVGTRENIYKELKRRV
ncbi:MAG: type II toxin-antitoxin system RelE/ParE family toxin [Bacillota bacterium]|nr:type II toxin-antitoxin system RelE/ParE family toxin [Bacillota bacterium]